jgi:hypothetical protein
LREINNVPYRLPPSKFSQGYQKVKIDPSGPFLVRMPTEPFILTAHWIELTGPLDRKKFENRNRQARPLSEPVHCAILVLRQVAVVTAIEEINGEADDKPHGKQQPGMARQGENQKKSAEAAPNGGPAFRPVARSRIAIAPAAGFR